MANVNKPRWLISDLQLSSWIKITITAIRKKLKCFKATICSQVWIRCNISELVEEVTFIHFRTWSYSFWTSLRCPYSNAKDWFMRKKLKLSFRKLCNSKREIHFKYLWKIWKKNHYSIKNSNNFLKWSLYSITKKSQITRSCEKFW